MPAARPASLKVRALQWLAQREHSRQELRDKLLRLLQRSAREAARAAADDGDAGHAPDTGCDDNPDPVAEVDAVLQWLEQHGHLSDARFTESRVHARQARFGNRRIQQELQQHGVSLDADARLALQQTELARATEVWRRKYGSSAADVAGRVRQMRFMVGRGFSPDVVRRVIQGAGRSVDSPDGTSD